MAYVCPGWLEAKALNLDSALESDYVEWFSHDALVEYLGWIRTAHKVIRLSKGVVLMVRDLSREQCLVLRLYWAPHGDLAGRPHARCEAFLVSASHLVDLLSGDFKAIADDRDKTYTVESQGGSPLPVQTVMEVGGERVRIWAESADAYDIYEECPLPSTSTSGLCGQGPMETPLKEDNERASVMDLKQKAFMVLLALVSVAGGGYYFMTSSRIGRLESKLRETESQLSECQRANERMKRFCRTREDFERNAEYLSRTIRELRVKLGEAEKVLGNIDKPMVVPPKPAPLPVLATPVAPAPATNGVSRVRPTTVSGERETAVEPKSKSGVIESLKRMVTAPF